MTTQLDESLLVYPSEFSCYQPNVSPDLIQRDTMLRTIDLAFNNGERAIVVSGDEGMGKTAILSQFLNNNKEKSVSLFIDVTNKQSYFEQNLIRDLFSQVYFIVNGKEYSATSEVEHSQLVSMLYSLQRALMKSGKKVYFVIDGLDDIPLEDEYIVESLMGMMPFSDKNVNFLFSSNSKALEKFLTSVKFKTVEMMLYSPEEAKLALPSLSEGEVKEVLDVYRGIPARINQVKRLLDTGMALDDVIQRYSESNESLLSAEWKLAEDVTEQTREILALITFSDRPLTKKDLCSIICTDDKALDENLAKVSFLDVCSGTVRFYSSAMKEFAREKLADLQSISIQKIIAYLASRPSDATVISELTAYNNLLGDHSSVLSQLSNSNILTLFNETKSVNGVSRQVQHGLNSAAEIKSEPEMFRFAHIHSFMAGMKTSKLLESELKCHLNHEDYDAALGLAMASKVLEERLHLLSTIATHQKRKKDIVDESLEQKIIEDFALINPEYLGIDRTIELATKLFTAFPEQALSLINGVDSLDKGGENKADYAFYRFSIEALRNDSGAFDKVIQGIGVKEDKKRKALDTLGLFKKGTPPEKIISTVSSFDKPGDAIFVLKSWINAFPESDDIFLLVEKLISLVISTTDYHANASLYADLTSSLMYMSKAQGRQILNKIVGRLEDLKKSGPTVDYVRLQCNIAKFELKHNFQTFRDKEIFEFICDSVDDASIKLSCLSLLHHQFCDSETNLVLNNLSKVKESVFNEIISNTADHYSALKDSLLKELYISYDNAISWAKRLNNQPAIDRALSLIINETCAAGRDISISKIVEHIRNIKDKDYRSDCSISFFDNLSDKDKSINKSDFEKLVKLRNRIKDNLVNTQLNSYLLKIMKNNDFQSIETKEHIIASLDNAWDGLDGTWQKIDVAYEIQNHLFQVEPEVAKKYKEKAIQLRKTESTLSMSDMFSQIYSIDLAIRCFYFLSKQNLDSEEDVTSLTSLISTIPARKIRVRLFARLASALNLNNKLQKFQRIVESFLIPEIDLLGEGYSDDLALAMVTCGPIIFCYSPEIFNRKLESIATDIDRHDKTLYVTHKYLMNKTLIHDPFSPVRKHRYKISAAELESHLYLVKKTHADSSIYRMLERIVKSISLAKKNNTFSKLQLSTVATEIECVISNSFMKHGDIQHEGYKLCCEALKLNVLSEKSSMEWQKLIDRARELPVESDKVIVLGEIIEYMPASLLDIKKSLLEEAVAVVSKVPSNLEKISRFQYLAEQGQDINKPFVKRFIKEAVLIATSEDTDEFHEKRLSLIDSVDSMDKDFAGGLAALYDDDPARKQLIERNVQAKQKERENRKNFSISSDEISENSVSSKYPSMMWELLGKLNADNHLPERKADFVKYLNSTSDYKPVDAYPMLSYYIHALGKSAGNKQSTSKTFRPIFDVIIKHNQLFSSLFEIQTLFPENSIQNKSQIVFDKNESEKVIGFFSKWTSSLSSNDLIIVDPYFTHEDLDFIASAIKKDPNFRIRILTSFSNLKKIQSFVSDEDDVGEALQKYWEDNITSDSSPVIDVIFCGVKSLRGTMPIHDRWWLSDETGLRLGGSMNGVMGQRISEVTIMQHDEVLAVEGKVMPYIQTSQRSHDGEKIKYMTVSM